MASNTRGVPRRLKGARKSAAKGHKPAANRKAARGHLNGKAVRRRATPHSPLTPRVPAVLGAV